MYKLIESYDAGGDLTKEWFVKYYFLIPDQLRKKGENPWQRFKVCQGINSLHSKTARKKQLNIVKNGIKELLKNGFNPFIEFDLIKKVSYECYTITNAIDIYFSEIKPNIKEGTFRKYRTHLNLFKKWIANNGHWRMMMFDVDKQIIHSFMKHNQAKLNWSNKTYNHYLNSLHAFFEYFSNNYDGYVERNPCKKLKRLEPMRRGNRPFDNYEFKTTLEYFKDNHTSLYNFSRFCYYSCMRPDAEARLIKVSDIDLMARRIRIGSDITKGKSTQVIPIDAEFSNFLFEMKVNELPRHFYLFGARGVPGINPATQKYYGQLFRPIKKILGLHPDVTLYAFKHTRVIHMVEDGEELYNIIKFTRHKSLVNLMDYIKDMGVIIGETRQFKSRKI